VLDNAASCAGDSVRVFVTGQGSRGFIAIRSILVCCGEAVKSEGSFPRHRLPFQRGCLNLDTISTHHPRTVADWMMSDEL
jgi:hypothetical protein